MRGRTLIASLVLAALAGTPLSAKKEPLVLKKSSKWLVDYKEDGCRLVREFGEGDQKTLVLFNRYGQTDGFQLTIAGKPGKLGMGAKEAELQFGPTEQMQKAFFHVGSLGKFDTMLFTGSLSIVAPGPSKKYDEDAPYTVSDPVAPERFAAIRTLTVGRPLSRSVVLELGPLDKPFAALSTCVDNLMGTWGLDAEKQKHLRQSALPLENPQKWMNSSDYPMKMLNAGQPALVQFRLMIDMEGKATSCHIQETTRPKEFDNAVCRSIMKRAKLSPAIDADGNPIASYYRNSVSFLLPQF